MVSKIKQNIKIVFSVIGAVALFIFGILAGRGRNDGTGTAERINDDINELGNRQQQLDDKISDSRKQADDIASDIDGATTIVDHSAASLKRAKDIIAELQRRRTEKANTDWDP